MTQAATGGGRLAVTGRVIAAIPANYVLTSIITALLARHLPMATAEASMAATLMSYAVFAVIAMVAFSASSSVRLWMWVGGATLVLGALLWVSIQMGGRL